MVKKNKPLIYTDRMKDHLELVMSGFTYIRCEKWNSKKTFYRFSIGSLDFKIVLYPTRCVDKTHIVYYDDNYSASWIVNSYYHHLNCAQTLRAVKTICALQDRYENLEFLDYLAGVAKRMSIDPRVLCSYRNYNKSFLRFDFIDSDEVKYYKMADELTKAAIQELCPHKDAFGATYYVIRNMVHSLLGCMLDSDGDNLKYECLYRKKIIILKANTVQRFCLITDYLCIVKIG